MILHRIAYNGRYLEGVVMTLFEENGRPGWKFGYPVGPHGEAPGVPEVASVIKTISVGGLSFEEVEIMRSN